MPYNTDLYPSVYTNICPTQAGEDPILELRRQLLILRNQQISAARVAGQNTAELQNQVVTFRTRDIDSVFKPAPPPVDPIIIVNKTVVVNYPTGPGPQDPQNDDDSPRTPPKKEKTGRRRAYFGGGFRAHAIHGQIERVGLTSYKVSTLGWYLQNARQQHAGVSSSKLGYWCGGQTNQNGTATADIEALRFENEARFAFATNLSTALKGCRGTNNNAIGLIAGGSGPATGTVNFITFRTEAVAASGNSLATVRGRNNNNQSPTHAYYSGGQGAVTAIEKIQFSNRAVTTASSTLGSARSYGATLNNNRFGWALGGINDGLNAQLLTVQRIRYSDDAAAVLSNNLGVATSHHEGVSDRLSGLITMNQGSDYKMREFDFKSESEKVVAAILKNAGRTPAPVMKP